MTTKTKSVLMSATIAAILSAAIGSSCLAAAGPASSAKAPAAALASVNLVPGGNVVVSRDRITLGDIFVGVPADRDNVIGDAPAPGERVIYKSTTLLNIARANDLDWTPEHGLVRVEVKREGRLVQLELIRKAIERRLMRDYVQDEVEIEIGNSRLNVVVPAEIEPVVEVENLSYNPGNRRFSATLTVPAGGDRMQRFEVQGDAYAVIEVPVLSRHAAPGEVIRKEDISWTKMRATQSTYNTVTGVEQLLDHAVRRPITAGRVIRRTDVQPLRLVEKGEIVTLVYRTPTMTLTIRGEALESGSKKDTVRVRNFASKKTIQGTVVEAGVVAVSAPKIAMN